MSNQLGAQGVPAKDPSIFREESRRVPVHMVWCQESNGIQWLPELALSREPMVENSNTSRKVLHERRAKRCVYVGNVGRGKSRSRRRDDHSSGELGGRGETDGSHKKAWTGIRARGKS